MLNDILNSFHQLWDMFLVLAPFFLLGLFLAGLLHVLVSKKEMFKIAGDPGMKGVILASSLGITLPLCSCGVAPVAVELKRKGASRQAIIAFLITTPETAIDAIMVTLGLLGPAMAIARPVAAYLLGIMGGFFAIGLLREKDAEPKISGAKASVHDHSHGVDQCMACLEHEPDYVGFKGLFLSLALLPRRVFYRTSHSRILYSWYRPEESLPKQAPVPKNIGSKNVLPLREVFRRIFNYSYKQLADDVLPGLIIGLTITLLIFFILPSDLEKYGMGKGFLPYLVMLAAGVPLYVCASASTPIAAALIYKGISPGAALVFLLTGPATNLPTVVILTRHFGAKFVKIYLACVMTGGLIAGILFDYVLHLLGIHVEANLSSANADVVCLIQWVCAIALIALIIWRSFYGDLKKGFEEIFANIKEFLPKVTGLSASSFWRDQFSFRSRLVRIAVPLIIFIYLASGLSVIPIGGVGYVRVFGHVVWKDLKPGLHYIPPRPFSKLDLWFPTYPQQVNIGLKSEQDNSQANSENSKKGSPNSEFLSGDENLFDLTASVQYIVTDPYKYYYQINDPKSLIADYLSMSIKDTAANGSILKMLSENRWNFEEDSQKGLKDYLDLPIKQGGFGNMGIKIIRVNIVNMLPPQEALFAFRDVMSAEEDRETYNLKALSILTEMVFNSRGEGVVEVQRAKGQAYSEKVQAKGFTTNIIARGEAVAEHRSLLENLLWLETSERVLSKPELYLLPPGNPPQGFKLWKNTDHVSRSSESDKHQKDKKKNKEKKKDKSEDKNNRDKKNEKKQNSKK